MPDAETRGLGAIRGLLWGLTIELGLLAAVGAALVGGRIVSARRGAETGGAKTTAILAQPKLGRARAERVVATNPGLARLTRRVGY
jgi:hypothetical protein